MQEFTLVDKSMKQVYERGYKTLFLASKWTYQRLGSERKKSTVFVGGIQRSGTNMLMEVLERSLDTQVFHETDNRAFDGFMMRDESVIRELVEKSSAPLVVVKALHESHELDNLMERFAPSKAFWMVRRYDDMVSSNMKNWPGGRNQLENVIKDKRSAAWRGLGMTEETHAILRDAYRPGMNDASAIALFWFYRNQLFFDQKFDTDDRVLPIQYEFFVSSPAIHVRRIAEFIGCRPSQRMETLIHSRSIGKPKPSGIDPHVRELCDSMQERMLEVCWNRWKAEYSSLGDRAALRAKIM